MRPSVLRALATWGALAVVVAAAVLVLSAEARAMPYDGDEGFTIRSTRFFDAIVHGQVSGKVWADGYDTHTQTMLTNYLVGAWLAVRGYDLRKLPDTSYDFNKTREENRALGRIPDDRLVQEVRSPVVALGVASVALIFLVGRLLGGPLAGLVSAGLALGSPLASYWLVQAVSQGPMMAFVLLALLLAILGARRGRDGALPVGWAVMLGIALGLAFQTKPTSVLSFVAVGLWAGLVAIQALRRSSTRDIRGAWHAAKGWALALVVGLLVFVLTNPHLYPNPIAHTAHLFSQRAREMAEQAQRYPRIALPNPLDRPGWVVEVSLVRNTAGGSRGVPFEAPLALVGIVGLAVGCWPALRRGTTPPAAQLLTLLTAAVYFAGVSAGLLLAQQSYLLPTLLLGTLLCGAGAATIVQAIRQLLARNGSAWLPFRGSVDTAGEPSP